MSTSIQAPPRPPARGAAPRQSHKPRRWTWYAAAAAVVLLIALAPIVHATHHTTPTAPPKTVTRQPRPATTTKHGYPQSSTGAQSAAANYAVQYGSAAMFNTAHRHAIVDAIADPTVLPSLQAQLDAAFQAVTTTFGLDARGRAPAGTQFVCRTLPIGTKTVAYDRRTAQVQVWTAGLIGLAGKRSTKPVSADWDTATISLHWTHGTWRWVAFSQTDGPTPIPGVQSPSSADAIASAASNFGGLTYAR